MKAIPSALVGTGPRRAAAQSDLPARFVSNFAGVPVHEEYVLAHAWED